MKKVLKVLGVIVVLIVIGGIEIWTGRNKGL